jgi:hypothetical protein
MKYMTEREGVSGMRCMMLIIAAVVVVTAIYKYDYNSIAETASMPMFMISSADNNQSHAVSRYTQSEAPVKLKSYTPNRNINKDHEKKLSGQTH